MEIPSTPPKKLLDQVRDALRLKYYSYHTEQNYAQWIRQRRHQVNASECYALADPATYP